MAEDDINDEDSQEQNVKKAAKHDDGGVADLEKVTDYVEEADIGAANFGDAMKLVNAREMQESVQKGLKEQELKKVLISKADVDLIVRELDYDRTKAERSLREHNGNLLDTLTTLTA